MEFVPLPEITGYIFVSLYFFDNNIILVILFAMFARKFRII